VLPEGFAYWTAGARGATIKQRLVGLGLMIVAVVFAAVAVALTALGRPEVGVVTGGVGSNVSWVLPGGPTWRDGIRPGHVVVELSATTHPPTWHMTTTDGTNLYATSANGQEEALRAAIAPAAAGLLLAGVAWLLLARQWVATALAATSLVLSSLALPPSGHAGLTAATSVAALIGLSLWLAVFGGQRPGMRMAVVAAAVVVSAAWLAARYLAPALFDLAEAGRQGAMGAGVVAMVLGLADSRRWRARLLSLEGARAADLVAVMAVVALSVFVALIVDAPLVLLAVLGLGAILLYPRMRQRLAATIDQILLRDVRARESLRAIEEERARIARDLHDEPLQEIAAAIRQLGGFPGTEGETELLRRAADNLRRVTAELRPPMLDDLGLRAGLAYLAEQAATRAPSVDVRLSVLPDDPLADRAPSEVELACFRIAQEAVENAIQHAAASSIAITASISAHEVLVKVADNGRGIDAARARQAMRGGHLGLVSMQQRAVLIGASLEIGQADPVGTVVSLRWQATS
jgi:signal transduction histidine kinase